MFGTVIVNRELLSKEEKKRYKQFYCGLCTKLEENFGTLGSRTLTYDMVFLSILLNSVYNLDEESMQRRCIPKPAKHPYAISNVSQYAADMNFFLAYYKCLDDWNDDANNFAKKRAEKMAIYIPKIKQRNKEKYEFIESCLAKLSVMEKENELNPDLPANCFGDLMAEIFLWKPHEKEKDLRNMGASLGRFIYLLDAVTDLKADIKKQRYNPLIAQLNTDFEPVLTMLMAECTDSFEKLDIKKDCGILRNILYSGVWLNYFLKMRTKKNGKESV